MSLARAAFVLSCIAGFAAGAQAAPLGTPPGYTMYASTSDPAGGFEYVRVIPDGAVLGHLDHALLSGFFYRNDYSKEYALDDTATLVTVDTSTAAVTEIGHVNFDGWTHLSITAEASTGLAYALFAETPCTETLLYAVDLTDGASQLVGLAAEGCLEAAMSASDGTFYAIDSASSSLVDILNGTIGALGFSVGDDATLYQLPGEATIYLVATDESTQTQNLYTVDTTTGHATLIAPVSTTPGAYTGIAVAPARPDDVFVDGFDG
jgi:hypothetical protein